MNVQFKEGEDLINWFNPYVKLSKKYNEMVLEKKMF
jgi:hypothetical protein